MNLKSTSLLLSTIFFISVSSVASLLYLYTNIMERKTQVVSSAAESINEIKEIEIQLHRLNRESMLASLLLQDRSHELNRMKARKFIERWLKEEKKFISSEQERALTEETENAVRQFLQARSGLDQRRLQPIRTYIEEVQSLQPALEKVDALANLNLSESRLLRNQAEIQNKDANLKAQIISILCLLAFPAFWLIFRYWAINPLSALNEGIIEFRATKKVLNVPTKGLPEIRSIASAFNELTGELTDQRRSQLRFLAGVAHDLKNPLSAIRMSTDLLQDVQTPDSEKKSITEIIGRQTLLLERMVGDFLELHRIEAGDLEFKMEQVNLINLIEDAVSLHQSLSSIHKIIFNHTESQIFLLCDPLRISQVLNNLLNNAIKYSPNGGLINVNVLTKENNSVEIKISDEGMGISSEDLPYIFEPFHRTKITKETIPGVGLGLSVVRRIIEAHNGTIEVNSQLGAGSQFKIQLPRES